MHEIYAKWEVELNLILLRRETIIQTRLSHKIILLQLQGSFYSLCFKADFYLT